MKLKLICLLMTIFVMISACTIEPKTQPIIVEEEPIEEDKGEIVDVTGAITKEIVNVSDTNETAELNETEMTKTIKIEDLKFKPNEITVPAGTTVIWKHEDRYADREDVIHMIMVYPMAERSERLFYGDTFEITFDEPGEYYFIDVIFKDSMRGDIIVE